MNQVTGNKPNPAAKADLGKLKGVSEKDKAMLEQADSLLGVQPDSMGFMKNIFWGRFREDLMLPYPENSPEETAACDQLLAEVEQYLKTEHPAIQIDQEQETPQWVIDRLFKMGVLGMTIPKEHGGLGMGITSYNRVLELIGSYCGSTAVIVSAHQSIGCKAVMLFGTDEQKKRWLPKLAREELSAFCLSEPNVGCDAGGQETRCEVSEDGEYFIINGEKKWATSGAISGLFTVMSKQKIDGKDRVTALVCTPDMDGIDIYQKNRSKCGIRGTWQARIKFTNVRVPRANLLHKEGKGLNVALTCLNYGRCTLSAGMLGGSRKATEQAIKWSQTRYQFGRPLSDFELVRNKIAHMEALNYAMDAMLYYTTGILDRGDEDIQIETAVCKVFCSEMSWRAVNDAMQILGGESYMTENEVERIFRDTRITLIVEGANEVMQSYIFGYGGRDLAEGYMLPLREMTKNPVNWLKPGFVAKAVPLGLEVFLGFRKRAPKINSVHSSLRPYAERLAKLISEHTYQFKQMGKKYEGALLSKGAVQARIADAAIWIHAWSCTLSKLDKDLRDGRDGPEFDRDRAAATHLFDLAELEINAAYRALYENSDATMAPAAAEALAYNDTMPAEMFRIPEKTPTDTRGKGRDVDQSAIKQFPGDKYAENPEAMPTPGG